MTPAQKQRHIEAIRLWFEFLKRSDYSSASPPYKDLGNVRKVTFEEWWDPRRFLFIDFPQRAVWRYREHLPEDYEGDDERFIAEVDLSQPRAAILKQFTRLVWQAQHDANKRRKRGRPRRSSRLPGRKAPYSLYRQPNIPSLQTVLAVHDLRKTEPNLKLWEIGERLKLNKDQITKATDTAKERSDKRAVMTATVSRYLKWAKALKVNAAKGIFPKT